ncbi:MAG: rhodanese-like domain-containing protein [Verrucomicrobiales bacterium]|nr:rhodanese-like domain-containing protein [Verrucomicrobiales bacterium]
MKMRAMGVALLALLSGSATSFAITAAGLREALDGEQKVTVVDLRSNHLFQESHIPGAINISHRVVERKSLPPLGRVVVYCDGLGSTYAPACVVALNAKPGIQAEALEGGYAAWQTEAGETTQATGMKEGNGVAVITYDKLVASGGEDMIVVDLSRGEAKANGGAVGDKGKKGTAFTVKGFCQTKLPGANMTSNVDGYLKRHRDGLLVLVDDDNETAMRKAVRLRASGYKRVVVLAGGAEILKRGGRAGSKRIGTSVGITDRGAVGEATEEGEE